MVVLDLMGNTNLANSWHDQIAAIAAEMDPEEGGMLHSYRRVLRSDTLARSLDTILDCWPEEFHMQDDLDWLAPPEEPNCWQVILRWGAML